VKGTEEAGRRGERGTIRRYAAGIAVEILSTLVMMAIAFLIAAIGYLLWR
jgi:hypothetical protein